MPKENEINCRERAERKEMFWFEFCLNLDFKIWGKGIGLSRVWFGLVWLSCVIETETSGAGTNSTHWAIAYSLPFFFLIIIVFW